jgi:hypothetical protein
MSATNRFAVGGILSILFFVILIVGSDISKSSPITVIILSISFIFLGLLAFIYGFIQQKKYQNVFDYEPTIFWGTSNTGLRVRNILTAFSVGGLWCLGTGIALAFSVL